ncbi:AAA family ATPase [uncultured Pontibacter sp.]|uniref:AAA family ATPase n=1 Tax=uncultured Pontibacter sp. TaxID=453356 RepID=UPI00260CC357|nr:AAA family ATPase [uncultured Pontibacter sp.]
MFKLLKLELKGHQILGDLKLDFVNEGEENNGPYSTIIIGPNGTGKSNILRALVDVYRDLYEYKFNGKRPRYTTGKFNLEFELENINYRYSNFNRLTFITKNGKETAPAFLEINGEKDDYRYAKFPNKIIASSILLNDKFPFIEEKEEFENKIFPIYKYLGIRSSSSSAGTKTLVKRTVSSIVDAIDRDGFMDSLGEVLETLDLKQSFRIEYDLRYKTYFYDGNLTVDKFNDFFINWRKHTNRKTDPWTLGHYKKISSDKANVSKIVDFMNTLSARMKSPEEGSRLRVISYDIFEDNSMREEYPILLELSKLDLIKFPKIKLFKRGKSFSLETSSSGEFHFISSLITIFSEAENNSLILIDEPEISLHPNWQMRYVHLLKKLFKNSSGVHFIICTHSHFIISDSKGDTSAVITLKNGETVEAELLDYNTYGWSAEDVLLNVFGVATSRNKFLADKISNLLKLIGNGENSSGEIKRELIQVKQLGLQLKNVDPLKKIISTLTEKYLG